MKAGEVYISAAAAEVHPAEKMKGGTFKLEEEHRRLPPSHLYTSMSLFLTLYVSKPNI